MALVHSGGLSSFCGSPVFEKKRDGFFAHFFLAHLSFLVFDLWSKHEWQGPFGEKKNSVKFSGEHRPELPEPEEVS